MKKYIFKPYSKIFPQLFLKEKERIASQIHGQSIIEHIGSTSIPELGGKGIIDIAIAVDKKDMELVSKQLQSIGYEFRPNFSTKDRLYFINYLSDLEEQNRRYHLHLTYTENNEWKEFLAFRDYLKNHPKELQEYAELKKKAVNEANNEGEQYRKIKEPFFKKIHSQQRFRMINNSFENKIVYQKSTTSEQEAILIEGITQEALKKEGMSPIESFAFLIKDSNLTILGGITGASFYGCLYIDSLWVTPTLRKQGWGVQLMQKAEELGKDRNCCFISLTTMDWEALPFYQKLDYEIEYIREGFENNSKMYILRKNLKNTNCKLEK